MKVVFFSSVKTREADQKNPPKKQRRQNSNFDSQAIEVSGTVLQRVSNIYGAGTDAMSLSRQLPSGGSVAVGGGGARFNGLVRGIRVSTTARVDSGFSDGGHLQYYQASSLKCGGSDKKKGSAVLMSKKKMKLLKGLSKGLSMASELGFSLESEKRNLLEEIQGELTSDAADVLLKQLEQLRAEEKEMKRLKKQEKAKLKASRMKTAPDCESSSSSSSESSDSDCGEVVDMRSLKASVVLATATVDQSEPPIQEAPILLPPRSLSQGRTPNEENHCELGTVNHHAAEISRNSTSLSSISDDFRVDSIASTAPQKRIEVCMGNKCKRSGAPALLQEFERVMGTEGAVVGCKCMGKCKNGPNVRVQTSVEGLTEGLNNDSVKIPANPLYIGVSLEDVDAIVATLLGESQRDIGSCAAAAT